MSKKITLLALLLNMTQVSASSQLFDDDEQAFAHLEVAPPSRLLFQDIEPLCKGADKLIENAQHAWGIIQRNAYYILLADIFYLLFDTSESQE